MFLTTEGVFWLCNLGEATLVRLPMTVASFRKQFKRTASQHIMNSSQKGLISFHKTCCFEASAVIMERQLWGSERFREEIEEMITARRNALES